MSKGKDAIRKDVSDTSKAGGSDVQEKQVAEPEITDGGTQVQPDPRTSMMNEIIAKDRALKEKEFGVEFDEDVDDEPAEISEEKYRLAEAYDGMSAKDKLAMESLETLDDLEKWEKNYQKSLEGLGDVADLGEDGEEPPERKAAPASRQEQEPKFKVVINGKEEWVTEKQLVANYQKNLAADKYLEDASRAKREWENKVRSLQDTPKEPVAPSSDVQTADKGKVPEDIFTEEELDDIVDALQYGDGDRPKEAVRKLQEKFLSKVQTQVSDTGRNLTREEVDKLYVEFREKEKTERILSVLESPPEKGGYKDVLDTERGKAFWDMASSIASGLLRDGAPDELETYQRACDAAKDIMGFQSVRSSRPNEDDPGNRSDGDLTARRARKRSIVSVPSGAGRQQNAAPATEKPKSASAIIGAMMEARGQG